MNKGKGKIWMDQHPVSTNVSSTLNCLALFVQQNLSTTWIIKFISEYQLFLKASKQSVWTQRWVSIVSINSAVYHTSNLQKHCKCLNDCFNDTFKIRIQIITKHQRCGLIDISGLVLLFARTCWTGSAIPGSATPSLCAPMAWRGYSLMRIRLGCDSCPIITTITIDASANLLRQALLSDRVIGHYLVAIWLLLVPFFD